MCPQSKCYNVFGEEVCFHFTSLRQPGLQELLLHPESSSFYSVVFLGPEPSSAVVTGTLSGDFNGDVTRPLF